MTYVCVVADVFLLYRAAPCTCCMLCGRGCLRGGASNKYISGRAGRDGLQSSSVVFYNTQEMGSFGILLAVFSLARSLARSLAC